MATQQMNSLLPPVKLTAPMVDIAPLPEVKTKKKRRKTREYATVEPINLKKAVIAYGGTITELEMKTKGKNNG